MSTFGAPPNPFGDLPTGTMKTVGQRPHTMYGPGTLGRRISNPTSQGTPFSNVYQPPTFLSQLQGAAVKDLNAQKTAADAQKVRLNGIIGKTQGLIGNFSKDYASGINTSLGEMGGLLGDIKNTGAAQGQALENAASGIMAGANAGADAVQRNLANVRGDVNAAYSMADAAVRTSADAAKGYDLGVTENAIGATISGMREHVAQQKQMIAAGLNPDGTMMSPAERQQASRELESDTTRNIGTVAAGMREQAQKTLADLHNVTASFTAKAADTRIAGAGIELAAGQQSLDAEQFRAGVGMSLNQQRLESQAGQRDLLKLSSGITELMGSLRTSAKLAGFQAEMSGSQTMFQEISSNPESVISLLPTLLMLGQVASAPGGRGMAGFDFRGLA